jgi:hypothetical protein
MSSKIQETREQFCAQTVFSLFFRIFLHRTCHIGQLNDLSNASGEPADLLLSAAGSHCCWLPCTRSQANTQPSRVVTWTKDVKWPWNSVPNGDKMGGWWIWFDQLRKNVVFWIQNMYDWRQNFSMKNISMVVYGTSKWDLCLNHRTWILCNNHFNQNMLTTAFFCTVFILVPLKLKNKETATNCKSSMLALALHEDPDSYASLGSQHISNCHNKSLMYQSHESR